MIILEQVISIWPIMITIIKKKKRLIIDIIGSLGRCVYVREGRNVG